MEITKTDICMSCLKQDSLIIDVPKHLIQVYLQLINDFTWTQLRLCMKCNEIIVKIKEFQDQCLSSINSLKNLSNCLKKSNDNKRKCTKKISKFHCNYCSETFDTISHLKHHSKEHKPVLEVLCEICSRCFRSNNELKLHTQRFHSELEIPCTEPTCLKTFGSEYLMRQHFKQTHSRKKSRDFICDICGITKINKSDLKDHIERVHLKLLAKVFTKQCPYCGKFLRGNSHYKDHVNRHRGVKKYVCQTCGMGCVTPAALRMHKYSHTHVRPYNCKLCRTGYYHIPYLRDHYKRIHNSEMMGYIKKDPDDVD